MIKEGFICVFINSNEPGFVRFEYADDWFDKLHEINSSFVNNPYSCYCAYKTTYDGSLDSLENNIIDSINPSLRMSKSKNFYEMSPECAFEILHTIAQLNGCENNLLYPSEIIQLSKKRIYIDKSSIDGPIRLTTSDLKAYNIWVYSSIGKPEASSMLRNIGNLYGISVHHNLTYTSTFNGYVPDTFLKSNWSLILNDHSNRMLYLFDIKPYTFSRSSFGNPPYSQQGKFYLSIIHGDSSFTIATDPDVKLGPYLKVALSY